MCGEKMIIKKWKQLPVIMALSVLIGTATPTVILAESTGNASTAKKATLMNIAKKTGFGAGAAMCGLMTLIAVGNVLGIIHTIKDGDEKPSPNRVIFNRIILGLMGVGFGLATWYCSEKAMPKTCQNLKKLFTYRSSKAS